MGPPGTCASHTPVHAGPRTYSPRPADVQCLLFENCGGFSTAVTRLLSRAAAKVVIKLPNAQYLDEATWATRSWTTMQYQRLSVALHMACAVEIVCELHRGRVSAPRTLTRAHDREVSAAPIV